MAGPPRKPEPVGPAGPQGSGVTSGYNELVGTVQVEGAEEAVGGDGDASGLYGVPAALLEQLVVWDEQPATPGYRPPRGLQVGDPDLVVGNPGGPMTRTVEEALAELYQMDSRTMLPRLQQLLLAGGFYTDGYYSRDPKAVRFGIPDQDTQKAWTEALTQAARSGKNIWDVLSASATANSEAPRKEPGPTVRLSNPDDIRRLLRTVGRAVLGGDRLTPEDEEKFIRAFQGDERLAQETLQGVSQTGGTVVEPPSAETAAESFVREARPVEAGGKDIQQAVDGVMNFILNGIN